MDVAKLLKGYGEYVASLPVETLPPPKDADGRCSQCGWFDTGNPNRRGYFATHHHTPNMAVYIDGYIKSEGDLEEWQQWRVFLAQSDEVVEIREDAEQLYMGDDFDMAWFIYEQWKQQLEGD